MLKHQLNTPWLCLCWNRTTSKVKMLDQTVHQSTAL